MEGHPCALSERGRHPPLIRHRGEGNNALFVSRPAGPPPEVVVAPTPAEPAPAPIPAPAPATPDNLEIIEGIGPKIAELFGAAGISTYAQLAASSPEALKAILKAGGSRFATADPGTWPRQAALAAARKWEELKALQDKLKAGKE